MERIDEINKKKQEIYKNLKKNLDKLNKIENSQSEDRSKTQNTINKIHFGLNELEFIKNIKRAPRLEIPPEKIEIPNKITIKKTQKSKNFTKWLLNNYEI